MIVLNFGHPLTQEHFEQLGAITGQAVARVIEVPCQVDLQQPLAPQVVALADRCGLSSEEWQTLPLLVNPPSLNVVAVLLVAELHGRCGYFLPHVRLRPVEHAVPPRFEVAEVLDLRRAREEARGRRSSRTGGSGLPNSSG